MIIYPRRDELSDQDKKRLYPQIYDSARWAKLGGTSDVRGMRRFQETHIRSGLSEKTGIELDAQMHMLSHHDYRPWNPADAGHSNAQIFRDHVKESVFAGMKTPDHAALMSETNPAMRERLSYLVKGHSYTLNDYVGNALAIRRIMQRRQAQEAQNTASVAPAQPHAPAPTPTLWQTLKNEAKGLVDHVRSGKFSADMKDFGASIKEDVQAAKSRLAKGMEEAFPRLSAFATLCKFALQDLGIIKDPVQIEANKIEYQRQQDLMARAQLREQRMAELQKFQRHESAEVKAMSPELREKYSMKPRVDTNMPKGESLATKEEKDILLGRIGLDNPGIKNVASFHSKKVAVAIRDGLSAGQTAGQFRVPATMTKDTFGRMLKVIEGNLDRAQGLRQAVEKRKEERASEKQVETPAQSAVVQAQREIPKRKGPRL